MPPKQEGDRSLGGRDVYGEPLTGLASWENRIANSWEYQALA